MRIRAASFPGTLGLCLLTFGCSGGASSNGTPSDPPATGASFVGAVQDRDFDATGQALVVEFDGAMNTQDLETPSNYSVTGAAVLTAVQIEPTKVRLTLNSPAVPGDALLTVAAGMRDADGEPSAGASLSEVTSTDSTAPAAARISGVALSGINNDQTTIEFTDNMVPGDVTRVNSWSVESPVGTPVNLNQAAVTYDEETRSATLTFGGGQNLATGAEISAVLTTMRDLGGNTIEASAFGAGAVLAEIVGDTQAPTLLSVFPGETANTLVYVFDEPVQYVETADLVASVPISGTRFTFAEASAPGVALSPLGATSVLGELGAEVTFSVAPEVGDAASVSGVCDLAGNPMLPALNITVEARNPAGPDLFVGSTELIAVEGERNDIFRLTFDTDLHPDGLFHDYNYGLLEGFFVNTLGAKPSFDGAREVTFLLRGPIDHEFQSASTYQMAAALLKSRQGVPVGGTAYEYVVTPTGDSTAPTLTAARTVQSNALRLVVEFSEALDETSGADAASYSLDGAVPTSATFLSPRIIALDFGQAPTVGQTLSVAASALSDRAGNAAANSADVAVQVADTTGPSISSVVATAVSGRDSDLLVVIFDELIDPTSFTDASTLSVTVDGSTVPLSGSELIYQSAGNTLTAELPGTLKLPFGEALVLSIARLADPSGNATLAETGATTVVGDQVSPTGLSAFVNYRADAGGTVIEVTPNESLRAAATGAAAWVASGGQTVQEVAAIGFERFRITLDAPLGAADTLTLTDATDLAGNVAGAPLVVDPTE